MQPITVQLLFAVIAGMLSGTLTFLARRSRRLVLAASALAFLLVLVVTLWVPARFIAATKIRIVRPTDHTWVGRRPLVEGSVLPSRVNVHVLVRPLAMNEWWVQQPVIVDAEGRWRLPVHVGSATDGILQKYEIVAVATSASPLVRLLQGGRFEPGSRVAGVPSHVARSNVIVVFRSE